MATKSILEVAVDPDDNFGKFKKAFDAYQVALQSQGGKWKDASKAIQQTQKDFTKLAQAAAEVAHNAAKTGNSALVFKNTTQSTERSMRDLARSTKDVAGNILSATTSLLKWAGITGIIGGLLGAGGLFGMDRLAASVMSNGKASAGMGSTYGQLQSAKINLQNLLGSPEGALGNIANMQGDVSKYGAFTGMGINGIKDKSPAQLLVESILSAKNMLSTHFPTGPINQQYVEARGYLNAFSMEDLRRIRGESTKDLNRELSGFQSQSASLDQGKGTITAWDNFKKQIDSAGQQIENVFVKKLIPLTGPLEQLSDAVAKAIGNVLDSPTTKKAIGDLSDGIVKFSKYLGSQDFVSDMEGFKDGIEKVVAGLHYLYDLLPDSPAEKLKKNQQQFIDAATYQEGINNLPVGSVSAVLMANSRALKALDDPYHLLRADGSNSRALPMFNDPQMSAEIFANKLAEFRKYFHGDMQAAEYAMKYGKERIWSETKANNYYFQPTAAERAGMNITIQNQTGGSAIVSTNMLPH